MKIQILGHRKYFPATLIILANIYTHQLHLFVSVGWQELTSPRPKTKNWKLCSVARMILLTMTKEFLVMNHFSSNHDQEFLTSGLWILCDTL